MVGLGVVEANAEDIGCLRSDDELLILGRRTAGFILAVQYTVVVHVERPHVFRTLVKCDIYPNGVLGFSEVVLDAPPRVCFDEVPISRPTRVRIEVVVSSLLGDAAVWTASVAGRSLVEGASHHYHGSSLSCLDGHWSRWRELW